MVRLELRGPLTRDDGETCLPSLGGNRTLFHTQGAVAPMLSFSLWEPVVAFLAGSLPVDSRAPGSWVLLAKGHWREAVLTTAVA